MLAGLHAVSKVAGSPANMLAGPRHVGHNLLQPTQKAFLQVLAPQELRKLQIKRTLSRYQTFLFLLQMKLCPQTVIA